MILLRIKFTMYYYPIGTDQPGKRNIEGLLPDTIKSAVRVANPQLVDQVANCTAEEKKQAGRQLKALYLKEFKSKATPGNPYFGEFYKIVAIINKVLQHH